MEIGVDSNSVELREDDDSVGFLVNGSSVVEDDILLEEDDVVVEVIDAVVDDELVVDIVVVLDVLRVVELITAERYLVNFLQLVVDRFVVERVRLTLGVVLLDDDGVIRAVDVVVVAVVVLSVLIADVVDSVLNVLEAVFLFDRAVERVVDAVVELEVVEAVVVVGNRAQKLLLSNDRGFPLSSSRFLLLKENKFNDKSSYWLN